MSDLDPPKKPATGRGRLKEVVPSPEVAKTPANLSQPSEGYKDLNFKVSDDFRRDYKIASAVMGISMVDILRESFKLWADKNGYKSPGAAADNDDEDDEDDEDGEDDKD